MVAFGVIRQCFTTGDPQGNTVIQDFAVVSLVMGLLVRCECTVLLRELH
jgi:hypothetical protein